MTPPLPDKFARFRELVLDEANEDLLLGYLTTDTTDRRYTGAYFHDLTYAGPSHPNRFDISDVASLSLLSVTLNGQMARKLTTPCDYTNRLEKELAREPDRDLGELSASEIVHLESKEGLTPAWLTIKEVHGVGPTRVSKLLSRKRPRLIPIWDSVISRVLDLPNTRNYWTAFHSALTEDDRKLDKRLSELAERSGVSGRYSRIRVLDILAWMHGKNKKNYEDEVFTELDDEPEDD